MNIQELREKRATIARETQTMLNTNSGSKWSAKLEQIYRDNMKKIDAIDDEIVRNESILERVAERVQGSATRGAVDHVAAVKGLGRFARSGDPDDLGFSNTLTTDPSSGGVVVPHELSDVIVSTQKKYSPLRNVARVVPVSTVATKYIQPIFNGSLDSGWVGETDARPGTAISALDSVEFPDAEVYANVPISAWLEEDSRIWEFIVTEIAKEFSRKEGTSFISGTGAKQPAGFLAAPKATTDDNARPLGTIQTVATGDASKITADSLIDLLYSLKTEYRANATWALNAATIAVVRKLKNSTGDYLWADSLTPAQLAMLLGYPVLECADMPDVAANATPIAIADWQEAYYILDRTQTLLRDPFTAKPNVLFYARKRVSGNVVDSNAIKLLKVSAT